MKTAQVIENGVVTNIIEVDDSATISANSAMITSVYGPVPAGIGASFMMVDGAGIGWVVSGNTLVEPAPATIPDGGQTTPAQN